MLRFPGAAALSIQSVVRGARNNEQSTETQSPSDVLGLLSDRDLYISIGPSLPLRGGGHVMDTSPLNHTDSEMINTLDLIRKRREFCGEQENKSHGPFRVTLQ